MTEPMRVPVASCEEFVALMLQMRQQVAPAGRREEVKKRPRIPWTVEELKRLYLEEDLSAQEVADRYGVPKYRIAQYLSRHGIRKGRQPKRVERPWAEEELKRLYLEEGLTAKEIGQRYGVPENTMSKYLSHAGIKRTAEKREPLDEAEVRRLYQEEDLTLKQLASRLGRSVSTMAGYLERHEIYKSG